MHDPYARITELDADSQLKLSESLELRASDQEMREIICSYLSEMKWLEGMRILEVGCGTGAITRMLAEGRGVQSVTGIDPSPIFIKKAESLNQHRHVSFLVADGNALPFEDCVFDAVVFHTVLCHVPSPANFLREAKRVLKPGGQLAIFDGDYTLRSVSIGEHDPLQACVEMMKQYNCHNPWLVRQLPSLLSSVGFAHTKVQSHGYLARNPDYMLNYLERGANRLAEAGLIRKQTADILMKEARQRVEAGTFFGFIPYLSFIAEAV
ncbi:methyltransferase domain-containing protein [Brevibacillus sp. B_LB10_24]|uniref:methyltransferase domain-containing protein n=1 Tax=Brevibacillus sp. B_LB10_24 TaxID=3380645 RepID=UPI0038B78D10